MQIEESVLFPRAIECLANSDWKTISTQMEMVDDPLFGRTVDREYRALYEYFSSRSDNVSNKLTKVGFLQFDTMIVSANAFENGMSEMWNLLSHHAGSFMKESQSAAKGIADNPRLDSMLNVQLRYAVFLGKQSINFAKDAAGIYARTVKRVVSPYWQGKSADNQDLDS